MKERPLELLELLKGEIQDDTSLNSQISGLINQFLKYLKEPRYQSPLTIDELANLFQLFYKDLESVVVQLYGQSNSAKRQLISGSKYFQEHAGEFDYLLAIASYSSSSIKLSRRTDPDAMRQLRIFSYYKLVKIIQSIEQAHYKLLNSSSGGESITLFDKIFRFNQRDILHQEFLDNKIKALRALQLPFSSFYENSEDPLSKVMEQLTTDPLSDVKEELNQLSKNITPLSKLKNIVNLQKRLMVVLAERLGNKAINNDLLLPSMIYLLVYKHDAEDLYLNFVYIKKFLHLLDPYDIELSNVNTGSTYCPTDRLNKVTFTKSKKTSLFEVVNISDKSSTHETQDEKPADDFFSRNEDLLQYVQTNVINNGELEFYLTNYEAVLVFLSNLKLKEIAPEIETSNVLLLSTIDDLVEREIVSKFEFPEGDMKVTTKDDKPKSENRSRSSSLINSISQAFNESRSRSNSSILSGMKSQNANGRENFPTLTTSEMDTNGVTNTEPENGSSFTMMRSILGRLSSVSVSHLRVNEEQQQQESTSPDDGSNPNRKTAPSISKLSPNHSRTRSSSFDTGANTVNTHVKRNSITTKFTNGVSDFMTKLNSNSQLNAVSKSISHSSLHSLEAPRATESQENGGTVVQKRPGELRSRTTSLQVMDKWFNNIGENADTPVEKPSSETTSELTRFQNIEFENLSIRDLYDLKICYDKLCSFVTAFETDGDFDKTINPSS